MCLKQSFDGGLNGSNLNDICLNFESLILKSNCKSLPRYKITVNEQKYDSRLTNKQITVFINGK